MSLSDPTTIRTEYHALTRKEVFPFIPKMGGTLLDLGGGIGATAAAIKSLGKVDRAGAVDLVPQDENTQNLDFHYSGNLEDPSFLENVSKEQGPFSVILCLDVLEHLSDPWHIVEQLHKSLAPNGIIVASIPNVRHYSASFHLFFRGRWDLEDAGIRDRTHLRWFVRETAIDLMTSSGLKLEEVVGKPGGGRKIKLIRAATFGLGRSFTDLQYLIRVRNTGS